MASQDVFANFSCLDELTQVIYQGIEKFVVISTVSDKWTIHLGLNGHSGRWWSGSLLEQDIHKLLGSNKATDKLLESFAEKLAELFIQGELCVSDWSAEKGARIKFTLGPTSKKAIHIAMTEMNPQEAAAYATKMFIEIALQAQSRKCRLYPSTADTEATPVEVAYVPRSRTLTSAAASGSVTGLDGQRGDVKNKSSAHKGATPSDQHADVNMAVDNKQQLLSGNTSAAERRAKTAGEKIQVSKTQLEKRAASPVEKTAGRSRAHKGASLANPNKKARKYQAIEFGSDDDDDD
ncbi:hypothetical protein CVT24_004086 [Panaeolus cyanescens]|uniref:Uncharacterized protein n=1 Tax=Panaeolus cyanescens TaxID=181874 RepID=A0A409Y5U3_9AGAR|nr:hypothetical protein CVT24_004086 [Panaeolus cyanescens]